MGRVTLTLPRLGETMEEARVTTWLVQPGASFARGDVLMEVETDKTVVEVPALADGLLVEQLVQEGATVALDQPIAEVEQEGAGPTPALRPAPAESPAQGMQPTAPGQVTVAMPAPAKGLRASPKARAIARRAGIDLALVPGTGRNGRVMAADLSAAPQHGVGGTAVLLHGLFDTHRGWRDLPQRLARRGHGVIAPDLPGHGDNPGTANTLDEAAAVMARQITGQAPSGPLALVGHSFGAALAVRIAGMLGPRVTKLVLIAPAGFGARINADFLDGMMAAETTAALGRALGLLDAAPVGDVAMALELERLKARRQEIAPLVSSVARAGIQQIDLRADIARLTCPLAVIFGTADRVLDWHDVAELPPSASIHLVRGAGHLPHATAPDLVPDLLAGAFTTRERSAIV
jgi:pyruvate dehydrogenase E2 component (dihydrolipoamide acetyltransferase)